MSEEDTNATTDLQDAVVRLEEDQELDDELIPDELARPEGGLVDHQGTVRSAKGVEPGSSGHLGAFDTEVTPTSTPVPGKGGDPDADRNPADETPGG